MTLTFQDVSISLGARRLLAVDAAVAPGETLTVMGPSGSGKSTLLALVAGFLAPAFSARGRVLLDGADLSRLPPEKRGTGLLFQDALLFPHWSVGGNLLFALPTRLKGAAARRAACETMLAGIGLGGRFDEDPATLSGGEAARVALARALLAEPRALLLDEPFSRLDAPLRAEMRRLVADRLKERAIPAVLVTHDEADATAFGGRVLRIGEEAR
ncbi:ATP-binding cassette domain-containing protein [Aurantimonas sp. Leaf443]|uniref:ATP-binding cassette domain-containing protein n=1 Tax=Aurantimonas sp. Leaf443 TaxID=1736378 RepID=UPI0006F706D4|nr:ATP-binding cassette domain-containing protein [Aurantimonas sp. Leaf443]KQT85295.1 ABC transporter ATP-binding protein [Aurantimonas sp. Leaf443]